MMMLYPSMSDLLKKVNNRYMLVNLTAKRARDIADEAEENHIALSEKPVKMALNDIMSGNIVLKEYQDPDDAEQHADDGSVQDGLSLDTKSQEKMASEEEVSETQQN